MPDSHTFLLFLSHRVVAKIEVLRKKQRSSSNSLYQTQVLFTNSNFNISKLVSQHWSYSQATYCLPRGKRFSASKNCFEVGIKLSIFKYTRISECTRLTSEEYNATARFKAIGLTLLLLSFESTGTRAHTYTKVVLRVFGCLLKS